MSKGSRPRPYSVSQNEFANNFDRIFRKDKRLEEEQQIEDEEFKRIAEQSESKKTDKQE